jgi:hypothetical protein
MKVIQLGKDFGKADFSTFSFYGWPVWSLSSIGKDLPAELPN